MGSPYFANKELANEKPAPQEPLSATVGLGPHHTLPADPHAHLLPGFVPKTKSNYKLPKDSTRPNVKPPTVTQAPKGAEKGIRRYKPAFKGEKPVGQEVVPGKFKPSSGRGPMIPVTRPYYQTKIDKRSGIELAVDKQVTPLFESAPKLASPRLTVPATIAGTVLSELGGGPSLVRLAGDIKNHNAVAGVGEAAGFLPFGRLGKVLKGAKEADEAIKAAHTTEEAAQLRDALKGAPNVRGAQAVDFSVQRGSRFAKAEAIYRDVSLTPEERQARASAALRGELDRPTFTGFKKMAPENVTNLKSQIMSHETLRTGQKATLLKSLDNAVSGKVPTAGEQKLFEQTFGKATSIGIAKAAKTGLWKNIATNIINTPRTLQSTLDMSAFLRQAAVALGRHPIITGKNFVPLVRSFASEKYALGVEHEIASRPTFPLMQEGKVAFTGSGALQRHEENFTANLLENIGGGKNPIRWSSRSYSAFLNKIRADIFDHLIGVAQSRGENVHDQQFLKELGELVNVYTGRGGLGSLERGASIFNGLFFSPRLAKSRLDILRQPFNLALARRNPFVYRQYVRAAAQTFGAMTMMLYLAKLNGAQVGLDPRSADFGKIKIGNTRIDLGAGFLQYFHLAGELGTGQSKSSTSGKVSNIYSGKYGQQTGWDIILNFGVGKASPPIAVAHDVLAQQTNFGKFNPWQELYQHLTPFTAQDITDVTKTRSKGPLGLAEIGAAGAFSALGGGLQTYGPKKTKASSPKPGSYFENGSSGGGSAYFGSSGGGGGSAYFGG